ncbi:MAG: WD40/YVTN/BNR-like repeat-containing protein [Gammaproteobacteria bacterium]
MPRLRVSLILVTGLALGAAFAFTGSVQAQTYNAALFSQMRWRPIGPLRGGRGRAVSGVPSEPNVFYIGNDDGGVWKTTDYGNSWHPIFDQEPTSSIGAIAVSVSDPNVIYVGTGESNIRPDQATGMGLYKSTDAGKTWSYIGLKDTQDIAWIAVDDHNPDRVLVAVLGHLYGPNSERGIYRSMDGGKTWTKVLYVNAYTSGDQVLIDPKDPNIVYATLWQQQQAPWENGQFGGTDGGIFKSTDGGNTWTKLTQGLPKVQQALMAIAPSDPSILQASVSSGPGAPDGAVGIYRSTDAGASWFKVTNDPRPAERIGGGDLPPQLFDPQNPNIVYSFTPVLWKSTDGGKTWFGFRGAPGGDDYQMGWINPNNPDIMAINSDQGAIVTVNGGKSFTNWYNQPTAAMYKVGIDRTWPYQVCGGQQDSGSACVPVRGNDGEMTAHDWHPVGVPEYGKAAPDPLHPNLIYGDGGGQITLYNRDTGQIANVGPKALRSKDYRALRTMPLLFSPVDLHRLYFASNVVWQTDDGGQNWKQISPDLTRKTWTVPASVGMYRDTPDAKPSDRGVVYALAPSPLNVNLIWAGTDDGLIWVTHDGGKHWDNVTPPQMQPFWRVFDMDASHFNPNVAYAAINTMWLDQMRPELFRTEDGGKHWTEIDNGITPDAATNVIREDPVRKGLLFAGTETQVWVSFDNGDHWQSLRLNMPAVSVRDLKIYDNDLIAATHGRGYQVLDDITPLRQIDAQVAQAPVTLYKPEPAVRVRWDMNPPTPWRMPAMPNPPPGAIIDYYLASNVSGPVTLEITTADGKLVRHWSSANPELPFDPAKLDVPDWWPRAPMNLSTEAGMHRFVWDMHYQPMPGALRFLDMNQAVIHNTPVTPSSPWVMPGDYTVKLGVGGRTYTQALVVTMDPRVKTSTADLEKQFTASMRAYQEAMHASAVLGQVRDLEKQIAARPASDKLTAYRKQLEELSGPEASSQFAFFFRGGPPTLGSLGGTLQMLMGRMQDADVAPTAADMQALNQTSTELRGLLQKWDQLKGEPLAELNRVLQTHHQPELRLAKALAPLDWNEGWITTSRDQGKNKG